MDDTLSRLLRDTIPADFEQPMALTVPAFIKCNRCTIPQRGSDDPDYVPSNVDELEGEEGKLPASLMGEHSGEELPPVHLSSLFACTSRHSIFSFRPAGRAS